MAKKSSSNKNSFVSDTIDGGKIYCDKQGREESFEQLLSRLEEISTQLDSETIGLDKAIDLYEEGILLSKTCFKKIREAELRISYLKKNIEEISETDEEFEL